MFDLNGAKQLRFRDPRRFGSVDLFADVEEVKAFLNARLGPEPTELQQTYFRDRVQARRAVV